MMHKRSLNKIIILWVILIAATAFLGRASVAADNGQTAADFLNIGIGARSAAMGGAYSAIAAGPDAAYWNPGGLTSLKHTQVMFSHFSWYQDLNFEYLALSHPVNDKIGLAFSASYLSYGTIEGYDRFDNPTGELDGTYDMSVGASVGYKINDQLSLGLTGKYILLSLAGNEATALAADLGARYRQGLFDFGLAVVNLGTGVDFGNQSEDLPTAIRGGLAVRPFGDLLLGSLEAEQQFKGDLTISNGYEFAFEDKYFVRAGYSITPSQDDRPFGQSLSFGVGAYFGPALFDYTFSPEEKYSSESIHRFSVVLAI